MKKLQIIVALVLIALTACIQIESEQVKIGILAPVTGPIPAIGNDVKNGILLAIEDINAAGGIGGKRIVPVLEDGQCDTKVALSAFKKLAEVDEVKAMLGITCTPEAFATQEISDSLHIPTVHSVVSGWRNNKTDSYVFNIFPGARFEGSFDAEFASKKGWGKVAVIYVDNDYGKAFKNTFQAAFEKLGGKVVIAEAHAVGESDFRTILAKVKEAHPDGIYLATLEMPAITLVKQANELGFSAGGMLSTGGILGGNFLNATRGISDGITVTGIGDRESPGYKAFVEKYVNKYGAEPATSTALVAYDSVYVLTAGLASGDDPEKQRNAIESLHYAGISGSIEFDEFGQLKAKKDFFIYEIHDGSVHLSGTNT